MLYCVKAYVYAFFSNALTLFELYFKICMHVKRENMNTSLNAMKQFIFIEQENALIGLIFLKELNLIRKTRANQVSD